MTLIDAYAEARHVGGCHTYNVKTAEARAKVVAQVAALTQLAQVQGAAIAALPSECDSPEICSISKSCASHGQAPDQPAGPCAICGSDEPFTGTCGSGDPRALCKQPSTSPRAAQQAPVRDYPPLPDFDSVDESIWSAIFKWQTATPGPDAHRKANTIESVIINQLRAYVDADRAARPPTDSVPAPAGSTNTKTHELLSTTVGLLMGYREGATRQPYEPGSVVAKVVDEAVDHLKDWPYSGSTPPAQAADSVSAVGRGQERIAFKDTHRHLELDEVPDAWARPMFKHSHVEASWLGWIARAARAPADSVTATAGGVVAYLDIGAGGYIDLGTDLSNEAISRLPKGRHALIVAGTYGIDGYTPTPPTQAAGSVLEDALRERDEADDFIDTLLDEMLGADRAEWSSAYGRADALEEVRERITALHKPAVDRAWDRLQAATAQAADSVLEDAARLTSEQEYAIRQGHEIAASDGYFDARPQIESKDRRKVFQAGFERGWDAARKQGANHD